MVRVRVRLHEKGVFALGTCVRDTGHGIDLAKYVGRDAGSKSCADN